jgi:hypothetical protein
LRPSIVILERELIEQVSTLFRGLRPEKEAPAGQHRRRLR